MFMRILMKGNQKINNERELENIAINSADFDYQDFRKIYRECTKGTIYFFDNRHFVTSQ